MSDTKLNGYTPDIAEENITALRNLFPDVCTEDKVDFEKLRQLLGEYVDEKKERYNFTWNGKGRALKLSQTPSRGTLLPCKEESKDWDSTENIYIEGDNLEVLKLLQKSYHNEVKMIYIDPPYNTGNDFVYPDDFSDSVKNYKQITGQVDAEGKNISTNPETNGRYHTDWLNMMYPRLRLARSLLRDDGVIFISIDDNEVANLQKVCDEIFGEDNFVAQMVWQTTPGSNTGTNIITVTEYILVYTKNKNGCVLNTLVIEDDSKYLLEDEYVKRRGRYILNKLDRRMTGVHYSDALNYPIKMPDGKLVYPGSTEFKNNDNWNYRWSKSKLEWGIENGFIVLKQVDEKWNAYFKQYFKVDNDDNLITRSLPYQNLIVLSQFNSTQGTKEIMNLFGKKFFDYPKPSGLIKYLVNICPDKESIFLDFFSGSSTTAHAVIQLNAEDKGRRKYILVQLPEPCDKKSEAYKAGYKTICDIGKERIRRAGDKIKTDLAVNYKGQKTLDGSPTALNPEDLDIGFKVFKLDTSNIVEWNPAEDLNGTLATYTDNYLHGRTEQDVVYELLLKEGYPLTEQIEEKTLAGKHIYSIQNGKLLICLDDHITTELAREIAKEKLQAESRIIFKDNGFASDSDKINTREILKAAGLKEEGFRTL
ncbi:MAG: site-specific DNA-methyltransferase [Methanocorpusculum sp.]|uniref:site-specific DNA-methyltransferase n=1 Tax=Methanocorpusculum sp. TaxID=2058474 RepID=UPI002B1F4E01|nr:site-specific DNA-methyltransferase [Methanocorpusculum sp.]MEA5087260.1 site-specific DNA-methyltransferase [Methanocorpusculum sp.]